MNNCYVVNEMLFVRQYGSRIVFDFLFFVVINILVLNLILGMIIDTFSHLRERELEKTKKLMNFCLTCGLPKVSFKEIIMLLYKPLHARRTSYPMGNKQSVDTLKKSIIFGTTSRITFTSRANHTTSSHLRRGVPFTNECMRPLITLFA